MCPAADLAPASAAGGLLDHTALTPPGSGGLLDYSALASRGVVRSRPTLHRLLTRPPGANPFPRPLRDTRSGRRYWREGDIAAWQAREAHRCAVTEGELVPDTDPALWAIGTRRHGKIESIL